MKLLPIAFSLVLSSVFLNVHANSPPNPQSPGDLSPVSASVGDTVSWDISSHFSDPDGDVLTFHLTFWSDPLPDGLSLDTNTGVISGTVNSLDGVGTTVYLVAQDPSNAISAWQRLPIHKPVSHGAFTDLFFRECDPTVPMCIPGYPYNVPGFNSGPVPSDTPDPSQSSVQYPNPPETTRAAAFVGYEGSELTPAISMYMRPANERFTGYQFGIARHNLRGGVTVMAELTYSQTGGTHAPVMPPLPEELPFGFVNRAQLFAFTLSPAASGKIDASLCDWASQGWPWSPWGVNPRNLIECILNDIHPHVSDLQIVDFPVPVDGGNTPGNGIVTDGVTDGTTTAELFLTRDPGPSPGGGSFVYIGISMVSMARYGGEVDSQNTLRVSFDNPEAVEPAMPEVTEPSFQPAPQAGGELDINQGQCININGHGRIPLVIKGGEFMLVELILVYSIDFGGLNLATRGNPSNPKPACSIADVDLDGFDDLTCQFIDDEAAWTGGTGGVLTVTWNLDGLPDTFSASDLICVE